VTVYIEKFFRAHSEHEVSFRQPSCPFGKSTAVGVSSRKKSGAVAGINVERWLSEGRISLASPPTLHRRRSAWVGGCRGCDLPSACKRDGGAVLECLLVDSGESSSLSDLMGGTITICVSNDIHSNHQHASRRRAVQFSLHEV
jgi:hypothetical protein